MSFRIFAAGNPGFHYVRENVPEEEDFEYLKIVNDLRTASPNAIEAAATVQEIRGGSDIVQLAGRIARINNLHNLNLALYALAMKNDDGRLAKSIDVSTFVSPRVGFNRSSYSHYDFNPGESPGAEFMKIVGADLTKNDLNNWSVLGQIAMALNRYSNMLSQNADASPHISIRISKRTNL